MKTDLLWLFLLLALCFGWFLGYFSKTNKKNKDERYPSPKDVKHRLQLFFDSYSDDSIDHFVHSLEVTAETFSMHLSIGKHFRAQGEVDKAILIHQNLMAHPELPQDASESVIYELAKDYKKAGLLDRAEALLQQLATSKLFSFKSLVLMLDVYEREKDWENAVSKGLELDLKKHPEIALRVAQYCCEIAELNNGQVLEMRRWYKQALSIHKACIRALIGLASLDVAQKEYSFALNTLKQVTILSPENIVLILPLLFECTVATQTFEQHQGYLKKLYKDTGQVSIMLAIVESYIAQGEQKQAYSYLDQQLVLRPNLTALDLMLKQSESLDVSEQNIEKILNNSDKHKISKSMYGVIAKVIAKSVSDKPLYRCQNCGFSGAQHHWMCPSCKCWQTTQGLVEYESTT